MSEYPEPTMRVRTKPTIFRNYTERRKVFDTQPDGYYMLRGDYTSSAQEFRSEAMIDWEVPYYHKRSAQGEIFNNPFKQEIIEETHSPLVHSYWSWSNQLYDRKCFTEGTEAVGRLYPYLLDPPGDLMSDAMDVAVNAAFAKVSSAEATLLVTLAEAGATKNMLLSIIKRVPKASRKIVRFSRYLRKVLAEPKTKKDLVYGRMSWKQLSELHRLTDYWLEVRYGIMPLIYDMQSLQKAVVELTKKPSKRQTFRAMQSFAFEDDYDFVFQHNAINYNCVNQCRVTGTASAGVLAAARLLGKPDVFGLTKIPGAMWELTTLSFVLDWFFNVGDTIAAWTPDPYWTVLTNWCTLKYTIEQTQLYKSMEQVEGRYGSSGGGWYTLKTTIKERLPVPERTLLPTCRVQMNWKRYIDAVALAKTPTAKKVSELRLLLQNLKNKTK